jgi:hypothetical protein
MASSDAAAYTFLPAEQNIEWVRDIKIERGVSLFG